MSVVDAFETRGYPCGSRARATLAFAGLGMWLCVRPKRAGGRLDDQGEAFPSPRQGKT